MELRTNYWTSDLYINSNKSFNENDIKDILDTIKKELYVSNEKENNINKYNIKYIELIKKWSKYNKNIVDYTACLKGLALREISKYLKSKESSEFIINFGGDIYAENYELTNFNIENTNFNIEQKDTFAIFTSGNNKKRGNHIKCKGLRKFFKGTCTTILDNPDIDLLPILDMYTTKVFANDIKKNNLPIELKLVKSYLIDTDGNLNNTTYIASPFFNEFDKSCRNYMMKNIKYKFIPGLTENDKRFTETHDKYLAKLLFEEDVRQIIENNCLVFPEFTDDLGTLMEIGIAERINKSVIRFNYLKNTYTITKHVDLPILKDKCIVDMSSDGQLKAILLGSTYLTKNNISYDIGNLHDNIMLSIPFEKVKKDNNIYKTVIKNYNEVN